MTGPSLAARPPRPSGVQRAFAERVAASMAPRRAINIVMVSLTCLAAFATALPLLFILGYVIRRGVSALSWAFLTAMPKPPGEVGGGVANAIVGTLIVIGVATAIGAPIGIGAGLFLAEQRGSRLARLVRFLADTLNGLPSIVIGIFAWQFLVRPVHHFSALAGGISLAAMLIPMVARSTEEMVGLVPTALGEAALALGYARWRTSLAVVLRTALPGIVTGALVGVARIAGETAPLLFTAFGNQFWSTSLGEPIAALPLQIFIYANSPYDEWHAHAWAGAFVLISVVLVISLCARIVTRARYGRGGD
ncbi:MAG: phosphate ABC transporter permease PstA [Gemmatimonadaceae bacterium]